MTIERLGTLYFDDPEYLEPLLEEKLGDEPLLGLQKSSTKTESGARLWLVVTTERTVLAGRSAREQVWRELSLALEPGVDKGLTSIALTAGDTRIEAGRLADSDLVELWKLAFEERAPMMIELAKREIQADELEGAAQLLVKAQDLADPEARNVAYLTTFENILLHRAWVAVQQKHEPLAIELLAELSNHRPGDDLISVARGELQIGADHWWLAVALAHEEVGDHASAARVYRILRDAADGVEDTAMYLLCEARSFRDAGQTTDSLAAYEQYIQMQLGEEFPLMTPEPSEDADAVHVNQGLVDACLESGEILEAESRKEDAAQRYVTLVRHAPLLDEGYRRLFDLADELDDMWSVASAAKLVKLLDHERGTQLTAELELPAVDGKARVPIEVEVHDRVIVHPRERAAATLTQKWVGSVFGDERDTGDIERHCPQINAESHPDVWRALTEVAGLAKVDVPRCFVSHGTSGIEVLGKERPFILIGAVHLDEGHARFLDGAELTFALATQIEHIRAGHLMLTSSEFWKTFGTKSLSTVLVLLPMGEILSKFTDSRILGAFGKVGGKASDSAATKMAELAKKRVEGGATAGGIQAAYERAIEAVGTRFQPKVDSDESLVKESLADFARSALYTADRFGLVASADLTPAVRAIFKLSPNAFDQLGTLEEQGLLAVLNRRDQAGDLVYGELTLRLVELLKFALSDELRRIVA